MLVIVKLMICFACLYLVCRSSVVAVLMAHFPFGDLFSCYFCAGISVVFVLAVFAFVLFFSSARTCILEKCPWKNLCAYAHGLYVQIVKYFLFFQIKSFKIVFLLLLFYVLYLIYNLSEKRRGAHAHGFVWG